MMRHVVLAMPLFLLGCDEPVQVTNPPKEALKVEVMPSAQDKADEEAYRRFHWGDEWDVVKDMTPTERDLYSAEKRVEREIEGIEGSVDPDIIEIRKRNLRMFEAKVEELKKKLAQERKAG